ALSLQPSPSECSQAGSEQTLLQGEIVSDSTSEKTTAESPETFASEWVRSANAAAASHQIRNRLQSIIVETALIKRSSTVDPTGFDRITAWARDGAACLEIFSELTPRPPLGEGARVGDLHAIATGCGIVADVSVAETSFGIGRQALKVLLEILITK